MKLFSKIETIPVQSSRGPLATAAARVEELEETGFTVLRWGLVQLRSGSVAVELALADCPIPGITPVASRRGDFPVTGGRQVRTAIVVPTGVGASMGGFIADAGPFARAVAAVASLTIVHPNVVNGGDFYGASDDTLYVDGMTLDQFFLGRVRLGWPRTRRIGLLIESMPKDEIQIILNAANAVRAIYGIDIVAFDLTDEPIGGEICRSQYGHFTGSVEKPEHLLKSVDRLQRAGADAIAVVTTCGGTTRDDWSSHYTDSGPNPVGMLEALISRFITRATGLPAAHAPAYGDSIGAFSGIVDPRAAGEVASGTGLPCVLRGLSVAPDTLASGGIGVEDLTSIIVPTDCSGGIPAWGAQHQGIPLLAVRSNHCRIGVAADQLNGPPVVMVETPAEALAWLACTRAGVAWDLIRSSPTPLRSVRDLLDC